MNWFIPPTKHQCLRNVIVSLLACWCYHWAQSIAVSEASPYLMFWTHTNTMLWLIDLLTEHVQNIMTSPHYYHGICAKQFVLTIEITLNWWISQLKTPQPCLILWTPSILLSAMEVWMNRFTVIHSSLMSVVALNHTAPLQSCAGTSERADGCVESSSGEDLENQRLYACSAFTAFGFRQKEKLLCLL